MKNTWHLFVCDVKLLKMMKIKGGDEMNLLELRKQNNLTQKELAEKLNVGSNTISQYELGKRLPNAIMLKKIANVLNCTVDDLLKE